MFYLIPDLSEGKVGCGKLPWKKLCDAKAKEEARKNTGLGASQTAEVAYLEKLGSLVCSCWQKFV